MSMNGIDISSWQQGIDLSVVPCDFVFVKATEGTSYINPDFERQYSQAKDNGKCLGVYHYAAKGGADAEADFFLDTVGDRVGEAILVLDWEGGGNDNFYDASYAKAFLDRVYEKTNVRAMIYMSKGVCSQFDWTEVVANNHPLWVAQYPNYDLTGYQSNPWTDGNGYGAWSAPAIFQYSSSGRLEGWDASLDINLAYMDKEGWEKFAKGEEVEIEADTNYQPSEPTPEVVRNYLQNGDRGDEVTAMQTMLIALGYDCGEYGADGQFGNRSTDALRKFQEEHGIGADGLYGEVSKATLEDAYNHRNDVVDSGRNYLQMGDKGDEVANMQNMLISCGYDCGGYGADGDFGNGSYNSLVQFQRDNGLVADGLYGNASKAKLEEVYNTPTVSNDDAYTRFVRGVQETTGSSVDGIAGQETLGNTPTISMYVNNTHSVVRVIQEYLNSIGYGCGDVDGIAGQMFNDAVVRYQNDHGCIADGELTACASTWRSLLRM